MLHTGIEGGITGAGTPPPSPDFDDGQPDLAQLCKDCKSGDIEAVRRNLSHTSGLANDTIPYDEAGRLVSALVSHDGSRGAEILSVLFDNGLCSSIMDHDGNTLLHVAASQGNLYVATKVLHHESQLTDTSASVANLLRQGNRAGYTPFGMAATAENYPVAIEILKHASGDPTGSIPDFKKHFFPKFSTYPLDKPVKVYFLGDALVGKSTLIQLLQDKKGLPPLELVGRLIGRQTKNVGSHFGGLITNDFYEVGSKRVMFCDLAGAGSINFFSKDLLDSSDKLECIIFVIVISLGATKENISERLAYWLSFLHFYTAAYSNLGGETVKPNVVVIASHKDRGSVEQLMDAYSQARAEGTCNFLTDDKVFALDCTKIKSVKAQELRNAMKRYYETAQCPFQNYPAPPSICYILSEVLYDSKRFPPILKVGDIAKKIGEFAAASGLNLYNLLPAEPSQILEMCETLSKHERLCLFDNPESEDISDKWIVHAIHTVLTEMDNCLQAAVENRSNIQDYHYGIVTTTALKGILSKSSMATLNVNVAMEMLQNFKYCELVQEQEQEQGKPIQYFFPNLLLLECPEIDQSIWDNHGFGFAWCFAVSKHQDEPIKCFLPRFLKEFQLALIKKFIPLKSNGPCGVYEHSSSNRVIAIWSRGVSWFDSDQIIVNITMNDDSIILSMQCRGNTDSELRCLELRNQILDLIRDQKNNYQNEINTEEFLIQCSGEFTLPIHTFDTKHPNTICLNEIQTEIMYGEYHDYLVFFEPCASLAQLGKSTQTFLLHEANSTSKINDEILEEIFTKFGNNRAAVTRHFGLWDPCATPTLSTVSSMTPSESENSLPDLPVISCSPVKTHVSRSPTTPKRLLSCLNSISIMNTLEFLQVRQCQNSCMRRIQHMLICELRLEQG